MPEITPDGFIPDTTPDGFVPDVEQPKEATFMQGLKAGALDQPAPLAPHWYSPASVGHFVGAAALPTAGFLMFGPVS